MSRIISFAWTAPALICGRKTVTRRNWKPRFADGVRRGDLIQAYDWPPFLDGEKIATIRIAEKPTIELMQHAPDSDYEAEGFAFLNENPHLIPKAAIKNVVGDASMEAFDRWRRNGSSMYVVRFELVELADVPWVREMAEKYGTTKVGGK